MIRPWSVIDLSECPPGIMEAADKEFVAWERWMGEQFINCDDNAAWWDVLGMLERIPLYCVMCDLADGRCEQKETQRERTEMRTTG